MAVRKVAPAKDVKVYAPNAFERKQVERALQHRTRYRYVSPLVRAVEGGICVQSPCCSRRVDAEGGVIDIAMLQRDPSGLWQLHHKDHESGEWVLHGTYGLLAELLDVLSLDPQQKFWQ